MSCNYADGLSPYANKGKLGLPEKWDTKEDLENKLDTLAKWVKESSRIVVHTGAGISTSAGIPDFRGPKGVWTLEEKGERPKVSLDWDLAKPTKTHRAIREMARQQKVKFVISQNIDGLHMRSGIDRSRLGELHGNMFVDQCSVCHKQFVRGQAAETVGQKVSGRSCPSRRSNGRPCRGRLADFVLDWEDALPDADLDLGDAHSCLADLNIVMGSTLQIVPAGNLPTYAKKYDPKARLVIMNLQPTKHDKKADLIVRTYVDEAMEGLFKRLGWTIPEYDEQEDPVKRVKEKEEVIEWTQSKDEAEKLKKMADEVDDRVKKERKELKRKRAKDDGKTAVTKLSKKSNHVPEATETGGENVESVNMCKDNGEPKTVDDQDIKTHEDVKKVDDQNIMTDEGVKKEDIRIGLSESNVTNLNDSDNGCKDEVKEEDSEVKEEIKDVAGT